MHGKNFLLAVVMAVALPWSLNAQFSDLADNALKNMLEQAEQGDAEAQFQYGLQLVTSSNDNKKSAAQGAAWIQKAAKQEHVKAMHVLGALYEEGAGVGQDFKLAAQWYEKAAEKGLAEAQTSIAIFYTQGKGVEKNDAKGAEWAKKAADQNHPPAQALYGSMLVRGDGMPKNASKAALWFLKAAKQNNGFAQRQLAYLYYTGNGVPVDYARCEAWYRIAASSGREPWAMNDLAWFLSTCPDSKYQNGQDAVEIARAAVKLIEDSTGEQQHAMIDTMAAALARSGHFTDALVWQKRCIALLKEDKNLEGDERKKMEEEFNERLKLYSEKKAYTDKVTKPEKEGEPLPNDTILEDSKRQAPATPQFKKPAPKKKQESVT